MLRFLQCCVYSLNCMINFRDYCKDEMLRKILFIILIPVGIINYIIISLQSRMLQSKTNKIGVVCIVKDEAKYVDEFISYYNDMGCDVIIYDNDSTDGTDIIAEKHKGCLYHKISGKKRQNDAYNHALKLYKKDYRYLCFFDVDEFLVCKEMLQGKRLIEILDSVIRENEAGLSINWLVFGSSGHIEYPKSGVVESFTQCSNDDFD